MAGPPLEISGSSIVLVGSFNPKIFQPEWFGRQGLLPQSEVEVADIKVILPQVCHFETERFILQITLDKFVAMTKPSTNPAPLGDLVRGSFFVLEHTPVTAMGINHHMHFRMGSEEEWHRVGDRLAPKAGWNTVLEGRPGLASLTIQTNRTTPPGAQVRVKVEPSLQVKQGVYFEINEHFPASDTELRGLMQLLAERWEESHAYASKIADNIFAWSGADT